MVRTQCVTDCERTMIEIELMKQYIKIELWLRSQLLLCKESSLLEDNRTRIINLVVAHSVTLDIVKNRVTTFKVLSMS